MACASALLLVTACTVGGESEAGTPSTTTTRPEPTPIADLPGRLVVLDNAGNIVTVDPDGSSPAQVTDDSGEQARYTQPFFSPRSDRIAWSEITTTGFGIGLSDPEGADRTSIAMGAPPFYMYWSPDGRSIGVLHNGDLGVIDFEMVDVGAGTTAVVADGSPFYFSWSPDSDRVAAHVQQDLFTTIDLEGTARAIGATAAEYQAPYWTPAGIFHLGPDGLEVRDLEGEGRLLATTPGPIAFVVNPQGTRVAAQSFVPQDEGGISAALSETPALPANRVVVVDVESGELSEVTDDTSIGFFWSPDGQALMVLKPSAQSGLADVLVWRAGEARVLTTIAPQPLFVRDVLRFFDQYAQSLQLWSPDSSAVALAGVIDDQPGIWVQSIYGGDAVKVFDGSWAAWSHG
ncbi:MAG: hypothetical protein ACRDZM_05765 [Acidimicrobiia bacterium]